MALFIMDEKSILPGFNMEIPSEVDQPSLLGEEQSARVEGDLGFESSNGFIMVRYRYLENDYSSSTGHDAIVSRNYRSGWPRSADGLGRW